MCAYCICIPVFLPSLDLRRGPRKKGARNDPYYIHICKTPAFVPDVNECDVQSPCQHHCYNLIGSFLCQCDQGYELAQDMVTCQGGHTHTHTRIHTQRDKHTYVDTEMYIKWQLNACL